MRSEAACIPCVLRQIERVVVAAGVPLGPTVPAALRPARQQTGSTKLADALSAGNRALTAIKNNSLAEPPSIFTSRVLIRVYDYLNDSDPFRTEKRRQTRLGRIFSRSARKTIQKSPDPIRTALHYAAAGNIIDVGTQASFDLNAAMKTARTEQFALDDYPLFRRQLKTARTILYILDNAGEIYFDMLFWELLKNYTLIVAAKRSPILNDVTVREAKKICLARSIRVIDTGSGFLGVDFAHLSPTFKTAYRHADIIIAKGQANFESLVDRARPVYFLLKAKCPVVAKKLGVRIGDSVFFHYAP